MSGQVIRAVIGKGFGDEGKGLAVDYFCSKVPNALVLKHNGGAQAGHTVEPNGKRFVFHQLSSGSFRHASTFWADSFYPDLYKLGAEAEEFRGVSGFVPTVFCDIRTKVTLIDDVLINMLLETLRGGARHGSCGMGINECDQRSKAGYGMSVYDFLSQDANALTQRMFEIRNTYGRERIRAAIREDAEAGSIDASHGTVDEILKKAAMNAAEAREYLECLSSKAVIENAVEEMQRNAAKYVTIIEDVGKLLREHESIVFESGQGLLLDGENKRFYPHVSASRTGLFHPVRILKEAGLYLDEAVYVTRSYVTRHGAGPLPYECGPDVLGITERDETNIPNPWQGSIRYATHGTMEEFLEPVQEDLQSVNALKDEALGTKPETKASLFLTHLNESNGTLLMADRALPVAELMQDKAFRRFFDRCYLSENKDSMYVKESKLV